jgi:hypothetical protein
MLHEIDGKDLPGFAPATYMRWGPAHLRRAA